MKFSVDGVLDEPPAFSDKSDRKRRDGATAEQVMDILRARISRHDLKPNQRIQEVLLLLQHHPNNLNFL